MNSNLLTELAARINEAYEAVASAQKGTLEFAIKTGELLQEAKNKPWNQIPSATIEEVC